MKGLSKEEKSWVLYDCANSAYTLVISTTILPMFFKLVAEQGGMSPTNSTALWGYTISIATLIVAILAPILGTIGDFKGNKKNFFKFFFFIGVIGTMALIFVPENKPILLLVVYTITVIGFSGGNIFYDSFLVDVTTENRMDKVSSAGFGLGYIGSTIPFIICLAIVFLSQEGILPINLGFACKITFLITAVWWGIFSIPMIKNVNQKYYVEKQPHAVINSFKTLGKTFKEIKSHKPIFLFLIGFFFYIDGVHTIISMSTSYGRDLGIGFVSLLVILLVTQFVAFPFTILYGRLADKYGGKKMIYVGIITYTLICCYAYFIDSTLDFWILAMAVGSAQGGIQAISRSYFAKLVPKEKSAEFFGFYSIFGKFASILGPFIVGIIAQVTGKTNNGILGLIPLFILGFLAIKMIPDTKINNNKEISM